VARVPETRYARSSGASIAYHVIGDGPVNVVGIPGGASNIELSYENPSFARWNERMGSFCRFVQFDKRGTGASDRGTRLPSFEEQVDDAIAVMDAAGCERAAVGGAADGAAMAILLASTRPERTSSLFLWNPYARLLKAPDYPMGLDLAAWEGMTERWASEWGTPETLTPSLVFPQAASSEKFVSWYARYERQSASPASFAEILRLTTEIDIRNILGTVQVPTLVMIEGGVVTAELSRYVAQHIKGAKLVEFDRSELVFWDDPRMPQEVEEFVTGVRHDHEVDRVLATILFTDIVDSTERVSALGDRKWTDLLDSHDAALRRELQQYRGREIKQTGDGFMAAFDGPARAIRCARSIIEAGKALGLSIRAGLHAGECEVRGNDLGGVAVHVAARVGATANAGEVLVSSTVKDLVAGSGIEFEDRGEHQLKGVSGLWHLSAVKG
jgi:class 3 adenylate cyclase